MKKRKRSHFRNFRAIYWWWQNRLTLAGKTIVGALLLSIPGMFSVNTPFIQLFAALLSLLTIVGVVCFFCRPRVSAHFETADFAVCHEPLEVKLAVTNQGAATVFDLQIDWSTESTAWTSTASHLLDQIGPGQRRWASLSCNPLRRGVYALPPAQFASTFPFGIFRLARSITPTRQVLVFPHYPPLHDLDLSDREGLLALDEAQQPHTVGTGDYITSREYQPGLAVRRWDYCSWARLGQPVVREFEDTIQRSLALIIDNFGTIPNEADECIEFERVLSLAASISDEVESQGSRIATMNVGSRLATPGHHQQVLHELAIASLEPPERIPNLFENLPGEWGPQQTTLLLLQKWDAIRSALVRELRQLHPQIVPVLLVDGDLSTSDFPQDGVMLDLATFESGNGEIR